MLTDEKRTYLLHVATRDGSPHRAADSLLWLPEGEWTLCPVDVVKRQILPPREMFQSNGAKAVRVSGAAISFADLTNKQTTVPCNKSFSSCCSSDQFACTPYTALLTQR
eukprot:1914563-Pleurochrysis_carterae.AAC.1